MVKGESGRLQEDVSTKLMAWEGDSSNRVEVTAQYGRAMGVRGMAQVTGQTEIDKGGGWAGKGMGGRGNGLGIMSGSSREQAGRGIGGGGMNGEGAGNELGSEGEQVGGGMRGEGKVICSENMCQWGEMDSATIGQVEVEEVGIRMQETSQVATWVIKSLGQWGGSQAAKCRDTSARGVDGWVAQNGDRVGASVALVDWQGRGTLLRTGDTCEDYTCHLKDNCKVKWLFHWLKRALDLKEGEKMNTSRWDGICSKTAPCAVGGGTEGVTHSDDLPWGSCAPGIGIMLGRCEVVSWGLEELASFRRHT
ncbi:hypothetical protein EDB85DRAFT_1890620 [Lactarius pseudohatsudake]|nr:hypothetical protein EDB85DRAFT_1890620 [Lactarius pseudohatsudake]